MSIKLKRFQVTSSLVSALESISELELPTAAAYNASRVKRKVSNVFTENREFLKKSILPFLILDDNGVPSVEVDEAGNVVKYNFKTPEGEKEFNEKTDAFLKEEVLVESYPITLSSLADAKVSVNDLDALEPVLLVECEQEAE